MISRTGGNYRLSYNQKATVAFNLVAAASSEEKLSEDAMFFLNEWLVLGSKPLRAFIDTWNIVLDNYTPNRFPILFRATDKRKRLNAGRICSYTGCFESADRRNKDKIIILDTDVVMKEYTPEAIENEIKYNLERIEFWKNHGVEIVMEDVVVFSFYPLAEVLKQHDVYTYWLPEDEYIVREPHRATSVWHRQRR